MDYSVRLTKLEDDAKSVKAIASVTINGEFKINNIAVVEAENGYVYINMPRYKSSQTSEDGQPIYKDICMPVEKEFAKQFYNDIKSVYSKAKETSSKSVTMEFKGTEERVETSVTVKASSVKNDSSIAAVASVCIDNCFAVRGIKVVNGKKGEFVSMPNYKTNELDENGFPVYKDICHPVTAKFREKLFDAILNESSIVRINEEQKTEAESKEEQTVKAEDKELQTSEAEDPQSQPKRHSR